MSKFSVLIGQVGSVGLGSVPVPAILNQITIKPTYDPHVTATHSTLNEAKLTTRTTSIVSAEYEYSDGLDCERSCDDDPTPRVCFYEWFVEQFTTNGSACAYCTPNVTNYVNNDCTCVRADGYERSILTVNRMIPGPGIYVCKGDKIVVDVTNLMDGFDTTIHWHGMDQRNTQYYDGVPYVTQCPIQFENTFRYQFWAAEAGTYFWHSHSGLQKFNGLTGSLVIKQARESDPNGDSYDYDLWNHTIILQDWLDERAEEIFPGNINRDPNQEPDNMLINGLGKVEYDGSLTEVPYAIFNVTSGYKYRFRLINAFASGCPAAITIQDHNITLISTDASSVKPTPATTIISMTGERYDFVLEANQTSSCYWIQMRGVGPCEDMQQLAVLSYDGIECGEDFSTAPTVDEPLTEGITINPVNATYTEEVENGVPVTFLEQNENDVDAFALNPNKVLFIPFGVPQITDVEEYLSIENHKHFVVTGGGVFVGAMNNISFEHPSSPLLSQYSDIDSASLCDFASCNETLCNCTDILKLDIGDVVDIFFIDTANVTDLYHSIHIHGTSFSVLAMGYASTINMTKITKEGVEHASREGRIPMRNATATYKPVLKDTIAIPTNGFALIRMVADNPGFWFVHCHIDAHLTVGMDMVIQVGELTDFPAVPENFPKCYDFKPAVDLTAY